MPTPDLKSAIAAETIQKEFTNTKLDADYATLLHYADALATDETSGSTADLCSWLYRGSKKLFSTSSLDDILPRQEDIRLHAYYLWVHGGRTHGHDVDDWLSGEKELVRQVWDRLGVESDKQRVQPEASSQPL